MTAEDASRGYRTFWVGTGIHGRSGRIATHGAPAPINPKTDPYLTDMREIQHVFVIEGKKDWKEVLRYEIDDFRNKLRAAYVRIDLSVKTDPVNKLLAQFEDYMLFNDISLENMHELWDELSHSEDWLTFSSHSKSKARKIYNLALTIYNPQMWAKESFF